MTHEHVTAAARAALAAALGAALVAAPLTARAQTPTLLDPSLGVATVVSGLSQPISMAFLGPNDFLVTEKASGQVKRVTNGVVAGLVLDLAVNSNSERGLLGMALHPKFPATPYVYLYNTESTTGADSNIVGEVPLLGNRVDRFEWNGSTLTFDRNIIRLRAFQNDLNNVLTNPPSVVLRGNHNGGVLRFGHDGKLYVIIGDNGRRGATQNIYPGLLPDGTDDAFGGPLPDNAHLTGVILRLNDDGSTPADNPFHAFGEEVAGHFGGAQGREVGENVKRIFAYGVRNSFGMTFDPLKGDLWTTENGGRAFDEINHVERGWNGGWVQLMGPLHRVGEYRAIESAAGVNANNGSPAGLQQARFPASAIAQEPDAARFRMVRLPGSDLRDPEFSWKYVVPPAGLGFIHGNGLGVHYNGDLLVGSAVARAVANPPSVMANPGHLYRFRLNGGRNGFQFSDDRLKDTVADNTGVDDFVSEGGEILFGLNFGTVTDIQTGPDGAIYLVSPGGTVRRISKN